jgi:hypothetical protein
MFILQSKQTSSCRFPWESTVVVAAISGFASMVSRNSCALFFGTVDTTYFSPFGMLAPHTSQDRWPSRSIRHDGNMDWTARRT